MSITLLFFKMQYPKEELKTKIIEVARHEFVLLGFQRSSLRKIARDAGMTTGGIYTYFSSKEDIFNSIVGKVVDKWYSKYSFFLGVAGFEKNFLTLQDIENSGYRYSNYHFLFNFISVYREEMKLLFFKSEGTQYQNFREKLEMHALDTVKAFLIKVPSKQEYPYFQISDFFMKNIISFNMNMVREMLENEIPLEKMLSYEQEISSFFHHGWKAILRLHSA